MAFAYHHPFAAAKLAVAELFSALLWLAAATGAGRCLFLASTHNVSNVASGRLVYLRHSVKHYETEVFSVCAIFPFLFLAAKIPIFSKWKRHFWQIYERFASFPSTQKKFCLFLPLPFREKSERPEKAHSSLYSLTVNLANSFWRTRMFEKVVFSLLCYCINANNINSGALPLFIIYCSSGRLDPTVNNKDKIGRLRSVGVFKTAHLSQKAKTVSNHAKHQDKE